MNVYFFLLTSFVFSCGLNCARWLWEGLSIVPRFLPPWAELADPSTVFAEKRGARLGDLSPLPAPRPSFGAFGQKVVIFDKSPPPVPFRTTVPFCPLAGEPGAVVLVGRGLVGPSPELSSWIAPLMLAVVNSISSWSVEAADATNHRLIIWYCGLFIFCSGVVCGGGGVLYAEGAPRGTGFSEVIASNVSNPVRQ